MTRNDKKEFVHKTQAQIIRTYNDVFHDEKSPYIEIDGTLSMKKMQEILKRRIVDTIL